MAKKSNEQFLLELKEKRPLIEVLEEYDGKDTPILCKCKTCKREWRTTPRSLLQNRTGTGCKECSKTNKRKPQKWTKEKIQEQLDLENRNIEMLGDYSRMNTNTEFMCTICNYVWTPTPRNIIAGYGCPNCSGAKRKTAIEFEQQLAQTNEYIEIRRGYVNARTKIECRCKVCMHEWSAMPNHLLEGNGCPNCAERNATSFSEQAFFFYLSKKYNDAISRFKLDQSFELDIFVPCIKLGIEYDGLYWHKNKRNLEIKKYEICKSKGIRLIRVREGAAESFAADYIINRNGPYNYKSLDESIAYLLKYIGGDASSVDTMRDANAIRAQYYTELKKASLSVLYPEIAKEWNFDKNGTIKPNMVSYGCNDKYWWKCSVCGREWEAAVCDRTISGKGCKECSNRRNADIQRKTSNQLQTELDLLAIDVDIIGEYKGTHEKIRVRCRKCKNEWETVPTSLLRGRTCQNCSNKKPPTSVKKTHEEFVEELKEINPNIVLIGRYMGNKKPISAQCIVCGEKLNPRPSDLIHGHYRKHLHL